MTKKIFLLSLFVASICSAQESFKEYYFPIGVEKEVKVYKYIDKNNPENIEYWKVTTNPETNRILTESFRSDFTLYNVFEEVLTNDGAELIFYRDFEKNEQGEMIPVDGIIIDKDVYKWDDTSAYKYTVQYDSPRYGNEQFIKERNKIRFVDIDVNGTDYSTIKFLDNYEVKSLENESGYKFHQLTYYAKGVGMVKYQRYLPDNTVVELELIQILSKEEFEVLLKS